MFSRESFNKAKKLVQMFDFYLENSIRTYSPENFRFIIGKCYIPLHPESYREKYLLGEVSFCRNDYR